LDSFYSGFKPVQSFLSNPKSTASVLKIRRNVIIRNSLPENFRGARISKTDSPGGCPLILTKDLIT